MEDMCCRGTKQRSRPTWNSRQQSAARAPLVSRWVTRQHLTVHSASCRSRWWATSKSLDSRCPHVNHSPVGAAWYLVPPTTASIVDTIRLILVRYTTCTLKIVLLR